MFGSNYFGAPYFAQGYALPLTGGVTVIQLLPDVFWFLYRFELKPRMEATS